MQHTAPVLPKHPGQLLDKVPSGKGRKDLFVPAPGLPLFLHLPACMGLQMSEAPTGGDQLGASMGACHHSEGAGKLCQDKA